MMVIGKTAQVLSCTINNIPLSQVTSCRNLGVTFNSDLNPSDHINDIVVRAHKRANLIHRCFTSREVTLLVRAFLTYVRPLVEHNCVIWSPSRKCDIIAIENVQRKFTKRLPGFSEYSYSHRLSLLEIHSRELRRLRFDLIYCYKIIFGHTGIQCTDLFELRSDYGTRGHQYKIFKHHCTCTARSSFFSERVVDIWNTLPPSKVDFSSLVKFKRSLKLLDLSQYLVCT